MNPGGLVGHRVVVRSLVRGQSGPSGGPALTDVVGRLLSADDGLLRVQRRDGTESVVAVDDVVALKQVPEGSARRRSRRARDVSAEDLARICTRGWPPRVSALLGAWTLRAAGGFTGRANSVAVHGDPGVPLHEALATVGAFYARQGLPAKAQVIDQTVWADRFAAAGWTGAPGSRDHAVVQVADLTTVQDHGHARGGVRVERVLTDAWLAAAERDTTGVAPEDVRHVYASPPLVAFLAIDGPEGVEAVARTVVTGEWAGLASVHTLPRARRRGHAARLLEAAAAWAAAEGADKIYLQTMRDNVAALGLYERYGFVTHHTYRYLVPPR